MKTISKLGALILFSTINSQLLTFAQGSLTPPAGAPAPVMKSLSQVEPRTPISSAPFIISQPGSYYLTTNLTSSFHAIRIAASDVTLDLGGWTIFSSATNATYGGTAILLDSGVNDVNISNGNIKGSVTNNANNVFSGPGFSFGIGNTVNWTAESVRVSNVSVSGVLYSGISLSKGASTLVESCTVRRCGSYGITASTINNSLATGCGGGGISGDQVFNCHGEALGSSHGINAEVVQNSRGSSSSGVGLYASSSATNCRGVSNSHVGLYAGTAAFCRGQSSTSVGLSAGIATSCLGTSTSGVGLSVSHNLNSF